MSKKDYVKILKESLGFGIAALGIYNILLLVRYFKDGMDRGQLPVNKDLFLTDIAIFAVTASAVMLVELISRKLHKNRRPDSSETSE